VSEAPSNSALVELGRLLRSAGYTFTTVTPLSHRRVNARPQAARPTLRDIFGWSRPFREGDISDAMLRALKLADAVEAPGEDLRGGVRFSTLGEQLFVHSAFPTEQAEAVFFGPDTYRFARTIRQAIERLRLSPGLRLLDVGAGSGAGGLFAARLLRHLSPRVVLTDINQRALQLSAVNAALNDVPDVTIIESDLYAAVDGVFDLIVSNPPYLVDAGARVYRHGGGEFGSGLSLRIVTDGLPYLSRGGTLVLYTGSAIVNGVDLFEQQLRAALKNENVGLSYEEIDPDVFGEELDAPPYDRADRICAVAAIVEKP